MKTKKIVLTGGPCGGKTASINYLSEKLINQNYSVKIINETAASLLNLGYMPNVNISILDFQNLLFKIQFLNEYNAEKKSNILLCDRGLFDGKVYMDNKDFQKILELNKIEEEKLLSTYDGALYFRSISHEYPEEFSKKRIYESPEVGKKRDEYSQMIWSKKIIPCHYDNLDGLDNKQEMIYQALIEQLNNIKEKNSYDLSDFYNIEYYNYIYYGIKEILKNNNISDDISTKTRRLVK